MGRDGQSQTGIVQDKDLKLYYTQDWLVHGLVRTYSPPEELTILEPCAGTGGIARTLRSYNYTVYTNEMREGPSALLDNCFVGDWFKMAPEIDAFLTQGGRKYSVVANPPWEPPNGPNHLESYFNLPSCIYLAVLLYRQAPCLRGYARIWRPTTCEIPIVGRPSFLQGHKTGRSEVQWYIWDRRSSHRTNMMPIRKEDYTAS